MITRFQIRTPQNLVFETVLKEMAEEAWKATLDLMNPEIIRGLSSSFYLIQIRGSVMPYLKKFDLCNHVPECSDEVEGAPWLDRTDRIYLLDLPGGLNLFLDDLSFETLEYTRHLFKPGSSREIFARLRRSFRHSLSRYLYFNPICGAASICADSKEVSPWDSEEAGVVVR
jgi:hypothetical protein